MKSISIFKSLCKKSLVYFSMIFVLFGVGNFAFSASFSSNLGTDPATVNEIIVGLHSILKPVVDVFSNDKNTYEACIVENQSGLKADLFQSLVDENGQSLVNKLKSDTRPKHLIVSLHGVRGQIDAFGQFHSIIREHLTAIEPSYEPLTINFKFPVGKEVKSTPKGNFDLDYISTKLSQCLNSMNLSSTDRVSLVAYSMGTQVGLYWYYSLMQDPRFERYRVLAQKLENFISLGGVFWGSKMAAEAEQVLRLKGIPTQVIDTMLNNANVSYQEVINLATGSDVITKIRQMRMEHLGSENLRKQFQAQFTNVVGVIPCKVQVDDMNDRTSCAFKEGEWGQLFKKGNELLTKKFFGSSRIEADGPVIVPSAQSGFIFARDLSADYQKSQKINAESFLDSDKVEPMAQTFYANVDHAALPGGLVSTDIAIIPEDCRLLNTASACRHPNYKFILRSLANCERKNSTCLQGEYQKHMQAYFKNPNQNIKQISDHIHSEQQGFQNEMRGFTVEFNFRLPKDYVLQDFNANNWKMYIRMTQSKAGDLVKLNLARDKELGSFYMRTGKDENGSYLRLVVTGLMEPKDQASLNEFLKLTADGIVVPTWMYLPGLKARWIDIKLKRASSTYMDIRLSEKD